MVEKEVLKTALGKLRYLKTKVKKKGVTDSTLDDISFIFQIFLRYFYRIRKECTSHEFIEYFTKKKKLQESQAIISVIEDFEKVKFQIQKPSPAAIKKLLDETIACMKSIEVIYRDG